jgi:hypothetical protein
MCLLTNYMLPAFCIHKAGRIKCMCKRVLWHVSPPDSSWTPGVFYTYFYNHARRLRLEKLLCLKLSRSPNGFFKVPYFWIQDPGGGFRSKTAVTKPFRK